jgi:hypothetical protein
MKNTLVTLIVVLLTCSLSYGQPYNMEDERYEKSSSYLSYELAWKAVAEGRYYSADNHINSSLRSRVTVQGLALKVKIEYSLPSSNALYRSILTYKEAERVNSSSSLLPPYTCIIVGRECEDTFKIWAHLHLLSRNYAEEERIW